jgi:hypothetical protein
MKKRMGNASFVISFGFPAIAILIGMIVCPTYLLAQSDRPSDSRIALVFGNSDYSGLTNPLKNPVNDARDIGEKLQANGWRVVSAENANRRDMSRRLSEFRDLLKANPGSSALFFYAGHGVQIEGKNYLLPIGEVFETPDDIKESAFLVDRVVDVFSETKARQSVIILDACRDNPFAKKTRSGATTRGLAIVPANESAEDGSAVIFATAPNDVAADGDGRNGVFTETLLKYMDSGLDLPTMFLSIRNDVRGKTGGQQNPSIVTTGLLTKFYLGKPGSAASASQGAPREQKASRVLPVEENFQLSIKGPVAGMKASINGVEVGVTPISIELKKGVYSLRLEHPDWETWDGQVEPYGNGVTEIYPSPGHSVAWRIGDLEGQRRPFADKLEELRPSKSFWKAAGIVSWVSAGLGIAAVGGGYLVGTSARASYDAATTAVAATSARSLVETASYVFLGGALGGAAGLVSGIVSLIAAPNTKGLERSISELDDQIARLRAGK